MQSTGYLIVRSRWLNREVKEFVVKAPMAVRRAEPGQFVMVIPEEGAERIPLTIAAVDRVEQTLQLVVQKVGKTTGTMCELETGDSLRHLMGPCGKPTEIIEYDNVVLVGGGVGIAVIVPAAIALRNAGRTVSAVIGGRSRDYLVMEDVLNEYCSSVYPCTDDGSYGFKGFTTTKLKQLITEDCLKIEAVLTAGPPIMMKLITEVTAVTGIPTIASLNPIMVDATGMCGGCRVEVGGKTFFACVDGPEFDAHLVNWELLLDRLRTYSIQEKQSLQEALENSHHCKLSGVE